MFYVGYACECYAGYKTKKLLSTDKAEEVAMRILKHKILLHQEVTEVTDAVTVGVNPLLKKVAILLLAF